MKVQSIEAIAALHGKMYPTIDGNEVPVEAVFPDAQYRTSEVYEMAVANPSIFPITGVARTGVANWSKASRSRQALSPSKGEPRLAGRVPTLSRLGGIPTPDS
jgi:hypothetical protein